MKQRGANMAKVIFKNIYKKYSEDVIAVKDFNLEIEDKEFVVLVGPSGCGKSTSLRMVAGLEDISEGEIYIGDALVNEIPPKDRDIAMVFQNYALYPHMTVYDNMAFGLKLRKLSKTEIDEKVLAAAKILGIEKLLDRKPKALSGGQRQRVALGRAIVRNPKVFLMDEPLSNLDAKLRVQTRTEIKKLHNELETTFIYVTHDQTEAMTMGDRIVIMKDGIIQQAASPKEVYDHPANVFVGGFIGSPQMNFIKAKVEGNNEECYLVIGHVNIKLSRDKTKVLFNGGYVGKEIIVGIRPEDVYCDNESGEALDNNIIEAKVDISEMLGAETYLYLNIEGNSIIARVDRKENYITNDIVKLRFSEERIHLFDKDTEMSLM